MKVNFLLKRRSSFIHSGSGYIPYCEQCCIKSGIQVILYLVDVFRRCMETDGGIWHDDLKLNVPLRIAVKSGKNWANISSL